VGKYKENVKRAVAWIIAHQAADGAINDVPGTKTGDLGYNHSACGLALAEAYGMARVSSTGAAAQKAVDYSVNIHQHVDPRTTYPSGWRYLPRQGPDTSNSGWFMMQLKSARVAGLNVPEKGFEGGRQWLEYVTVKPGDRGAGEPDPGRGLYRGENVGRAGYTGPAKNRPTCTAIAACCRVFLGMEKPGSDVLLGAAEHLMERPPDWERGRNFYHWYYATLAMFQIGGTHWKEWNEAMRDVLIAHQRLDGVPSTDAKDVHGSWDYAGADHTDGRVMSTALAVLCLEVYYRYLPIYRSED
jgi:hypothetical protein